MNLLPVFNDIPTKYAIRLMPDDCEDASVRGFICVVNPGTGEPHEQGCLIDNKGEACNYISLDLLTAMGIKGVSGPHATRNSADLDPKEVPRILWSIIKAKM